MPETCAYYQLNSCSFFREFTEMSYYWSCEKAYVLKARHIYAKLQGMHDVTFGKKFLELLNANK